MILQSGEEDKEREGDIQLLVQSGVRTAHLQLGSRFNVAAKVGNISQEDTVIGIALSGPAPVQRPENQRHNIPSNEHIHAVVLPRRHYQHAQHRYSHPCNDLHTQTLCTLLMQAYDADFREQRTFVRLKRSIQKLGCLPHLCGKVRAILMIRKSSHQRKCCV